MAQPSSTGYLPPQIPMSLKFYSGGFFGSSLWLEWDGSNLYRKRQHSGGSNSRNCPWVCLLPPTAQAWFELRRVLDELKAWRWRRKWSDPGIMDGWQWDLGLVWGPQKWSGSGSNNAPQEFRRVERLLEKLGSGRKAPGLPAGFSIRANHSSGGVEFIWDGRHLHWWCRDSGKEGLVEGDRSGIPSEAWKKFNRAFATARRAAHSEGMTMDENYYEKCDSRSYTIDLERGSQSSRPWLKVLGELARLAEVTLAFGPREDGPRVRASD